MSLLYPTPEDVRAWLEVVAHPQDEEARRSAESLIAGAFVQSEIALRLLETELKNAKLASAQREDLVTRTLSLIEGVAPARPASSPPRHLRLVREG